MNEMLEFYELNLTARQMIAATAAKKIELTLPEVTRMVLDQNVDIKISHLTYDDAKRDITRERAAFDPVTAADFGYGASHDPNSSGTATTLGETQDWGASVTKQIETGGTISLDASHGRTGRKHAYSTGLGLTVSQPLLEGFGKVALTDIRIAQHNFTVARQDLMQSIMDRISDAQSAYWEILNAREVLRARVLSKEQADFLVQQSKKEMELGKRIYADVLQAEATAASRAEEVLRADNDLQDTQDELKKIISVRHYEDWATEYILLDEIDPNFVPEEPDLHWCVATAFDSRPDYRRELTTLKVRELSLSLARNALLPDLSIDYTYNFTGAGLGSRESFDALGSGNFHDWDLGVSLTFPWWDRDDREAKEQSRNAMKRQELNIRDLQLEIIRQVRLRVREVQTDIRRVQAAELAYILQTKKLEAEQKRLELGMSTSYQVLLFQEDLANASIARIRAIVDYHQALIRLWQTLGITLEKNNITFDPALVRHP